MNEQTSQLIRELAEKLGTTSEYLWQVLIKQAPISGAFNLLAIAFWVVLIVWGYRVVKRNTKKPPVTEADRYPSAQWCDEGAVIAWIIWTLAILWIAIVAGCNLEMIIASFFNPEYWALKQILK